jgi:coenzyme F420-0:L-glutamate ligase/coenzyme F420-1:gamma-L-glutamate ligase
MLPEIHIIGLTGIPEIEEGAKLGDLISAEIKKQDLTLNERDILVVTQKVVSKAEGRIINLKEIEPSHMAIQLASEYKKDPRLVEVVLRESKRIVRMDRGVIISETHHGFICANAGVDSSNNTDIEKVSLLPKNPDVSANNIRQSIHMELGVEVGIIISDTFGRPWREGATNVAIGVSGINPLKDYRGQSDLVGYSLKTTTIAIGDELAAAAELVMAKLDRVPVAVIKGYHYNSGDTGINSLVRNPDRDLFR